MPTLPRHIDDALVQWLENSEDLLTHIEPLSSGATQSARVITRNGLELFVKWRSEVIDGFFTAEMNGLTALSQRKSGLRIPQVYFSNEHFIAMDYIATKRAAKDDWLALGIGLAHLHSEKLSEFGFHSDTFCGPTQQDNRKSTDGFQFFTERRLLPLTELARNKGLLQRKDCRAIETLCARLPALLPPQPPCLIHGDLWSGNVMFAQSGIPVLIDPAAYQGWAEAELAMTLLFGGFDDSFYAEYQNHSDMDLQWQQRAGIYNLYHLLNHLTLFGEAYLQRVLRILKGFYV